MSQKNIVCLVPARNAEKYLPRFLQSITLITDTVIALDDGSDDNTGVILKSHNSVKHFLQNPVRHNYSSWDDAKNRTDLLRAAESLNPDWILFLDADESIPETDALKLKKFINEEARTYAAYGFRVHRMINDENHFDKSALWVYRLFYYRKGLRLSPFRLHFLPVPIDIPKRNYFNTPYRIKHFSSLKDEDRLARYHKYQECDPDRVYQKTYENLLAPLGKVNHWNENIDEKTLAYLRKQHQRIDHFAVDHSKFNEHLEDDPLISVIVISQNDASVIYNVIQALTNQTLNHDLYEIILVNSGSDDTCDIVSREFKSVRIIKLQQPALPGKARNAGLSVAKGYYISFPGSHIVLPPNSLEYRLKAHLSGFEMITGTTINGNKLTPGWASYFMDHHLSLPSRRSKILNSPPVHCSYMRAPLLEVGGFPEDRRTGEDTYVNMKLFERGYRAFRQNQIHFIHESPCTSIPILIKHHFNRGVGYGRILAENSSIIKRPAIVLYLILIYPLRRFGRIAYSVIIFGRPFYKEFVRCSLLIVLGILSAGLGAVSHLVCKRK